jgi:hypothetical protein
VLAKVPPSHIAGTTIAEFEAYKPVSPESVFAWLLDMGAKREDAQQFMLNRGYTQFGEPEVDPLMAAQRAYFTLDRQDATMEGFYLAFPQFKPDHVEVDPADVAAIGAEFERLLKE